MRILKVYFEKTSQIFILYNNRSFKNPNVPIQRLKRTFDKRVNIDEIKQKLEIAFKYPLNDFCFTLNTQLEMFEAIFQSG